MTELIGLRVRHFRTKAGLSQKHLGERVGRSSQWVSAIERAERNAGTDRLTTLVPLLLALRVSLLTFLTKSVPEAEPFPTLWLAQLTEALNLGAPLSGDAWSGRTISETGHDSIVIARDAEGVCWPMNRRQAGKRGFQVLGVFGLGFAMNQDQTQAVGHALETHTANAGAVQAYQDILTSLRRADDLLGSSPSLVSAAAGHLATVKGWLATAEPESALALALARLAVEYTVSGAWMAHDSGNFHRAVGLHRDALPLATHVLRDRPLAAHLMEQIAFIESEMGYAADAVRDAERAANLFGSSDAWQIRALVDARRSLAYGRVGDWQASRTAMAQAEEAANRTGGTDTPYIGFVVKPGLMEHLDGRGLAYLGRHEKAQVALRKSLTLMPEHFVRARAMTLTLLAESQAASGDVPSAGGATALLRGASSRRLVGRLNSLHGRLVTSRSPKTAGVVKELGDHLREL